MVAVSRNIVSNSKELTGGPNKNRERADVSVMDLLQGLMTRVDDDNVILDVPVHRAIGRLQGLSAS